MFRYLLVRREDRKIFRLVKPRYLVLDEIHTYVGILGAEVACLLRRFKEHAGLEQGELCCVGTSATVMPSRQHGEGTDSQHDLLEFTANLFGEPFAPGSILTEAYRPWNEGRCAVAKSLESCPDIPDELLNQVNIQQEESVRQLASCFQIDVSHDLHGNAFFQRLYAEIEPRLIFSLFEEWLTEPLSLDDLAQKLQRRPERVQVSHEACKREAMAVLLLGSAVYTAHQSQEEPEPRYRPGVHFNMRSMTPLALSLNAAGKTEKLLSEGETDYPAREKLIPPYDSQSAANGASSQVSGDPSGEKASALPLAVCRSCGTPYLKGYYEYDDQLAQERTSTAKRKGR